MLSDAWEIGFNLLKKFQEREGHCTVPRQHKEVGYPLGNWVSNQRQFKYRSSSNRIKQLNEIGFVWEPNSQSWDYAFTKLIEFCEREGHLSVPTRHEEDGFKLGMWVGNQRVLKSKLTADRRQKLDAIGFVWFAR
jgi:hypothetical protein